jgi:hypothetical protein
MQFLSEDESSLLHSILVNHILIANESSRSDLLINCGLQSLLSALSSLESSSLLFVNELCARFSLAHITSKPSGQPGLVALLTYIAMPPYDDDLSPEEKKFLERVKKKCQQWYESQHSKQSLAAQLLDQELQGQKQLLPELVKTAAKFNRQEIITSYGLYSLMSEFANRVNYGKASAFAVSGDFSILRDYIIERMCQKLGRRVPGAQTMLDISLNQNDVTEGESVIEKKVVSRSRCDKLIDLFKKYPKTHIVLVVWCYAFPPEHIKIVATHFWQEVEQSVSPFLREQSQCFVLILANVDVEGRPYQIDNFTALQTPSEFAMHDLLPWMQGRLENLGIEQNDIELCLERLKDQRGDFIRTYREMEYILNFLQRQYSTSS